MSDFGRGSIYGRGRALPNSISTGLIARADLITKEDSDRLAKIKEAWNFYEGYQWEDTPPTDTPELTINFCRSFVDKFVSFELGKAFSIRTHPSLDDKIDKEGEKPQVVAVTEDGRSLFSFLEDVWEDNDQYSFCIELGQTKSIEGGCWVQVRYFSPDELEDPFKEYPNGRIGILPYSTGIIFPKYDPHRKGVLTSLSIIYEYEEVEEGIIKSAKMRKIFEQTWTNEKIVTKRGNKEETDVNELGYIPFVYIKNIPVAGSNEGRGDLDDIIPLNVELNTKSSNVSEIIDYHASPITVVYGAKIGNLEKGANKVWGGLPKDSKVENLTMQTELGASTNYISFLKTAMCIVGSIPENTLGGSTAVSNTSGVALQYINLPLIEKTRIKKMNTQTALEIVNKMVINISLFYGLIKKPDNIEMRDFLWNEVTVPDTLPKDMLMEGQQIQAEMKMGVESRKGGMRRLGKENIDKLLLEIEDDILKYPTFYGIMPQQQNNPQINSGMTNGQTPLEQVRIETTGQNGGAE